MTIADYAREAGRLIALASTDEIPSALGAGIGRFLGAPFRTVSTDIVDSDGSRSPAFAAVVYVAPDRPPNASVVSVPADNAAAIIDACACANLEYFRAAHARVALAKRLKKSAIGNLDGKPRTTVTLGIIFAQR